MNNLLILISLGNHIAMCQQHFASLKQCKHFANVKEQYKLQLYNRLQT